MSAPADHTKVKVKIGMQFCELEASTGITWEGKVLRELHGARSLTSRAPSTSARDEILVAGGRWACQWISPGLTVVDEDVHTVRIQKLFLAVHSTTRLPLQSPRHD